MYLITCVNSGYTIYSFVFCFLGRKLDGAAYEKEYRKLATYILNMNNIWNCILRFWQNNRGKLNWIAVTRKYWRKVKAFVGWNFAWASFVLGGKSSKPKDIYIYSLFGTGEEYICTTTSNRMKMGSGMQLMDWHLPISTDSNQYYMQKPKK